MTRLSAAIENGQLSSSAVAKRASATTARKFAGPLFDLVDRVLRPYGEYAAYRAGALPYRDFAAFLERMAPILISKGVPPEDVSFAKRYPRSTTLFVRAALRR